VLFGLVILPGVRKTPGFTSLVLHLVSSLSLSLIPCGLQILRVLPGADHLTIEASPCLSMAACPSCGSTSRRIHSNYVRRLRDLPSHGQAVMIQLSARRFRCLNVACVRKTFAERLDDAMIWGRRTKRLGDLQRHLGLALGGEAGTRLAERVALPISADTLLRMVASTGTGMSPAVTPRVLAVDDWAWRRGHRYGIILVDLERNRVVDLLPDRQAATLANWLRQHPGIEIVARDRAGACADGIRQGAPDAVQVADRWHMLRNLGDAVQAVVDRHHAGVRRVAKEIAGEAAAEQAAIPLNPTNTAQLTSAEQRSQDAYARRQARYEEAAELRTAGVPIKRIAASIGVERKTVRSWLRIGGPALWRKPPQPGGLAPYQDYLDRRWTEGCHNAAQLWRELVERGFSGRPGAVRQWAGRRRKGEPKTMNISAIHNVAGGSLSARQIASQLMTDDTLPKLEQNFVACLLKQVPELAECVAAAKRLTVVLCKKGKETLDKVLEDASKTALGSFVANLRNDIGAVQAALDLPWTTSPAEGQINRLKMLKRTMYGRAGFGLLRARVLYAT
jgi:transposase